VWAKKPDLVFLMETKLTRQRMELVKTKLDFDGLFVVDCIGKSGGLALLWETEVQANIQNYSR
jgi:hypothetical protein